MENYEQKYKEALGRANAKIETYNHLGNASVVKSICEIFPELKESEDERIRKSLIGHLKECRNNTRSEVMIGEYAKWIAWLEKQGEQKPAWSENDESIFNDIMHNIHFAETHRNITGSSAMEKEQVNWLKSLKERYTWKPSDEQMKTLQESIGIVGVLTPRGECLRELIEQLKKLKEE